MTKRDGRAFDAIVVGGGLAGLAATQRLAAHGRRVALVEKRDRLGGSSAMSGGWFALSGTKLQRRAGVEDSDDLFLADMLETGGGFADEALLRALVDRQANAVVAIDHAGAWTDELKVSAGMSVARAHLIRIGDLLAHLENEAVAAGAVILPGHAAGGLVTDGSRVVGITSESGVLIAGSGVVLASGGLLALARAARALRAGPGGGHAVRRRRQHGRRASNGLDAGCRRGRHRAGHRHLRPAR